MKFAVILLVLAPLVCLAQGRKPLIDQWKVEIRTDKMSDVKKCFLNSPAVDGTLISFQGSRTFIALKGANVLAGSRDPKLLIRVDKNQPLDFSYLVGRLTANTTAMNTPPQWLDEMKGGRFMVLRLTSDAGMFEGEWSLVGFPAAYTAYAACLRDNAPVETPQPLAPFKSMRTPLPAASGSTEATSQ